MKTKTRILINAMLIAAAIVIMNLQAETMAGTVYAPTYYTGNLNDVLNTYIAPENQLRDCSEYAGTLTPEKREELKVLAQDITKGLYTDYDKIKAVYTYVQLNCNRNYYKTNFAYMSKQLLNAIDIPCAIGSCWRNRYNFAYDRQNKRWIAFDSYEGQFDMDDETIIDKDNASVTIDGATDGTFYYAVVWGAASKTLGFQVSGIVDGVENAVIPDSVDGWSVWSIEGYAFAYNKYIRTVYIPDSVHSMGECVFAYCDNLESVRIPQGFGIAADTFVNCAKLRYVEGLEHVNRIDRFAFSGCASLQNITISSKVTTIGARAFEDCIGLIEIEIPGNVKTIDNCAFWGCSNLQKIILNEGIEIIGNDVFNKCDKLESVMLPTTIKKLEPDFWGRFDCDFYAYCGTEAAKICAKVERGYVIHDYDANSICKICAKPEHMEYGKCGDNVTYELDKATGVLRFTGTGYVDENEMHAFPYRSFVEYIKFIEFTEGIIGYECTGDRKVFPNLVGVYYPESWQWVNRNSYRPTTSYENYYYNKFDDYITYDYNNPPLTGARRDADGIIRYYYYGMQFNDYNGLAYVASEDIWAYMSSGVNDCWYQGLCLYNEVFWYVNNGKVDFGYTGAVVFADNIYAVVGGVYKPEYCGFMYCAIDTNWYYMKDGEIDRTFTDLAFYNDAWWMVINGKIDFGYNDMFCHEGAFYAVQNGCVDWNYSGLMQNGYNKDWFYFDKGVLDWTYTGLTYFAGEWWYVRNGRLKWGYDGVVVNGDCAYTVRDSRVCWSTSGLQKCENDGRWYYMKDGVQDKITGLVQNAGYFWYVVNGVIDTDYVGLVENEHGSWFVAGGKIDINFTGIGRDNYNNFVAIRNGKYDKSYTGLIRNQEDFWYIKDGMLDLTFTGIVENTGGKWLVTKGKLCSTFRGNYILDGIVYKVINGKIIG